MPDIRYAMASCIYRHLHSSSFQVFSLNKHLRILSCHSLPFHCIHCDSVRRFIYLNAVNSCWDWWILCLMAIKDTTRHIPASVNTNRNFTLKAKVKSINNVVWRYHLSFAFMSECKVIRHCFWQHKFCAIYKRQFVWTNLKTNIVWKYSRIELRDWTSHIFRM